MKPTILLMLLCLPVLLTGQQMTIDAAGPLNGASYVPAGLPGSGIAQGSIFVVKGTNLCAAGYTKRNEFPYQTSLQGTVVQVYVGSQNVNAFMVYVYGGLKDADGNVFDQIAAILPSTTPVGNGTMTVFYNGRSATAPIKVVASGPGIFSLSQSGSGPGVITDNVTWKVNTITNAFNDKTWTNIWATGLGPLPSGRPDDVTPPVGNLNVNFELWVGNQRVDASRIAYFGRAPGNPGLDQIAFQPPVGLSGCSIPVFLKVGSFYSNTVTISLGSALRCSDPLSATPEQMDRIERGQPLNVAKVMLVRADIKVRTKDSSGNSRTTEGKVDTAYGRFSRYQSAYAPFSQEVTGLPTLGNCIVTQRMSNSHGTIEQAVNLTNDAVPHTVLNAGQSLSLNGGQNGTRTVAAPAKPAAIVPPTSVQITFQNKGSDATHIFVALAESFGPSNKLAINGTRMVTSPYVAGLTITFNGGRNGTVLATGSVKLDGSFSKVLVVFDETSTLKITTSGGTSSGIAMFQTTLSSGYYKLLGAELKNIQLDPDAKIDPLFLNNGAVTAITQRTSDIGPINTSTLIPTNPVDWTDKDTASNIVRSQGYLVRWSGGNSLREHVAIYGHSAGTAATTDLTPGVAFVCTAPVDARQFTIPANILQQLPASKASLAGILSIGTSPLSSADNFTAEGIESGKFTFTQTVVRSVTYQ
jgi:uncharacterized protein (TIGR03437 family)